MFIAGALLAFVVTLLVIFIAHFKWTYQYWRRRNVPFLEPSIPFGNMGAAFRGEENFPISLRNAYDQMKSRGWRHGGLFTFDKPMYVPLDCDYLRNILTKDFRYFEDRDFHVNRDEPLQNHLLGNSGLAWKRMRSKLSPVFASGKVKTMFNIMTECLDGLEKRMDEECSKNEPIDVKEVSACFTTNIIGAWAFGLDCRALEDENSEFRAFGRQMFTMSAWQASKQIFVEAFPNLARYLRVSLARADMAERTMRMVEDTIGYRERNNYRRNDFMQVLIDMKNGSESGREAMDMDEIGSHCLVFYAAGFETSSTMMTFALYELAKNQDVQGKLRNEINEVLEEYDDKITYEALQKMKYLGQVIDESLRKHPPAASTNRKCVKDYKIPDQDIIIEKGTNVTISILGIHYDEKHYRNPEKFDPDRFSEKNKKLRDKYAFLPFGGGPRNCIGLRFGLLQGKIGLASLIKNYRFAVDERTREPITYQKTGFVLAAEGDIWLNAEKVQV